MRLLKPNQYDNQRQNEYRAYHKSEGGYLVRRIVAKKQTLT
jgi:hypothetical protein